MAYRVVLSADGDHDFNLIFKHLVDSYVAFGDTLADAFQRATRRVGDIEADMNALGRLPHQGTRQPALGPDIREVTKSRAVYYFQVDDSERMVRVIAVFFGAQDHQRHMLARLRET